MIINKVQELIEAVITEHVANVEMNISSVPVIHVFAEVKKKFGCENFLGTRIRLTSCYDKRFI